MDIFNGECFRRFSSKVALVSKVAPLYGSSWPGPPMMVHAEFLWGGVWGCDTLNNVCHRKPQKAHPCMNLRRLRFELPLETRGLETLWDPPVRSGAQADTFFLCSDFLGKTYLTAVMEIVYRKFHTYTITKFTIFCMFNLFRMYLFAILIAVKTEYPKYNKIYIIRLTELFLITDNLGR